MLAGCTHLARAAVCGKLGEPGAAYYPINATGNLTDPGNFVSCMQNRHILHAAAASSGTCLLRVNTRSRRRALRAQVWFMEGTTDANGNLNGNAANSGLWRKRNQRSFVLFHVDKSGDHSGHSAASAAAASGSDALDFNAMRSRELQAAPLHVLLLLQQQ